MLNNCYFHTEIVLQIALPVWLECYVAKIPTCKKKSALQNEIYLFIYLFIGLFGWLFGCLFVYIPPIQSVMTTLGGLQTWRERSSAKGVLVLSNVFITKWTISAMLAHCLSADVTEVTPGVILSKCLFIIPSMNCNSGCPDNVPQTIHV